MSFTDHVLMENRNGLIVETELTAATGRAERLTAIDLLGRLPDRRRRRTLGADKGYDTAEFVTDCRQLGVNLHKTAFISTLLDRAETRPVGRSTSVGPDRWSAASR